MTEAATPQPADGHDIASRARALRAQKLSTAAIAEQLGISQRTVLKLAPGPRRLTPQTKAQVRDLYMKGATPTEIAKQTGVSRAHIGSLTEDLPRQRARVTQEMIERIHEMRDQGISREDIARRLGLHVSTVSRHAGARQERETLILRARELREQGKSTPEIAQQLKINYQKALRLAPTDTPRPRLAPATKARIVELYDQGLGRNAIAKRTGASLGAVQYHTKDRPRRPKLVDADTSAPEDSSET